MSETVTTETTEFAYLTFCTRGTAYDREYYLPSETKVQCGFRSRDYAFSQPCPKCGGKMQSSWLYGHSYKRTKTVTKTKHYLWFIPYWSSKVEYSEWDRA